MTDETPDTAPTAPSPAPAAPRRKKRTAMVLFVAVAAAFLVVLKVANDRERVAIDGPPKPPMSATELQQFSLDTAQALLTRYHGLTSNATQRALVERVGATLVTKSSVPIKTSYHFHLLAEPDIINLFALPNGNVYVTTALVNRMRTEGQLAAALAQGIAHSMARDVLAAAEPVAADGTPVAANPPLHYTTKEELAADPRALKLMSDAGYDPNAVLGMFTILTDAYTAGANVEFFITHPNTANRMQLIVDRIKTMYPNGVPAVMSH